jgi:hypothetical protein
MFNVVPIIRGFAPSTRQPDIPEVGDNADS